jgi:formylmethanofuran--tetrahydromethanopterin N-formyltransferase
VNKTDDGFEVRHRQTGHICTIEDTFAEMFPMWAGRILITANTQEWALTAARTATGFAASIIMSPAEAGIEGNVPPHKTPDGRFGVLIQIFHRTRNELKSQMGLRLGQCIMTCPTTSAFDALAEAKRRLNVGRSLRLFGDGFQKSDEIFGRKIWRIPVMEGEFIVENQFGAIRGVAGGNFLIFSENVESGLLAAERGVKAIKEKTEKVILPFPGGICRAGSKAGSIKYKLPASTNLPLCPKLKKIIPNSQVPNNVESIYEIVINGLNFNLVKNAMAVGIKEAAKVPGVIRISAANFGGRLGPYKASLKEVLNL